MLKALIEVAEVELAATSLAERPLHKLDPVRQGALGVRERHRTGQFQVASANQGERVPSMLSSSDTEKPGTGGKK